MLYNTADMERGGAGDGDTVAILEGTQLCCTRQLRDLLHCLGGVSVLLPLFAQLGRWPGVVNSLPCTVMMAAASYWTFFVHYTFHHQSA